MVPNERPPSSPAPPRVVVAHRSRLYGEALACVCEAAGYRLAGIRLDGEQCLQLIETEKPELAVLGFDLESLSTVQIVRRARMAGSTVRIVLVAEPGDPRISLDAFRAGAHGLVLTTSASEKFLEALDQARKGGVYIAPEVDISKVLRTPREVRMKDPLSSLSSREHQVFSLVVKGLTTKQIAQQLDVRTKTVYTYRANMVRKLKIKGNEGFIQFAVKHNLTSQP